MPRAVVDTTAVRHELKSAPPDGFVELKRMPYGDWLHRTDISLAMQIEMAERNQKRGNKRTTAPKQSNRTMDMQLQNKMVTTYEFSKCIVSHNLMDENDNILDFKNPASLDKLDPKIGTEIGELINELHELSEDEEGNS